MNNKTPLAEMKFHKTLVTKKSLIIQFVTEIGTNKTYFRFVGPEKIEGYAGNAEDAEQRALEIADKLNLEIYDEIIYIAI